MGLRIETYTAHSPTATSPSSLPPSRMPPFNHSSQKPVSQTSPINLFRLPNLVPYHNLINTRISFLPFPVSTYTSSNSKPNPNPNPKLPSPSPAPISFLAFLSSHLPDSPARTLRFKTILFLQGSQRYDYDEIRQTLESDDATLGVLSLERAIVYGKVRSPARSSAFSHPLPVTW
jgi:hypothetical protein